jgi:hypothetical protein
MSPCGQLRRFQWPVLISGLGCCGSGWISAHVRNNVRPCHLRASACAFTEKVWGGVCRGGARLMLGELRCLTMIACRPQEVLSTKQKALTRRALV